MTAAAIQFGRSVGVWDQTDGRMGNDQELDVGVLWALRVVYRETTQLLEK